MSLWNIYLHYKNTENRLVQFPQPVNQSLTMSLLQKVLTSSVMKHTHTHTQYLRHRPSSQTSFAHSVSGAMVTLCCHDDAILGVVCAVSQRHCQHRTAHVPLLNGHSLLKYCCKLIGQTSHVTRLNILPLSPPSPSLSLSPPPPSPPPPPPPPPPPSPPPPPPPPLSLPLLSPAPSVVSSLVRCLISPARSPTPYFSLSSSLSPSPCSTLTSRSKYSTDSLSSRSSLTCTMASLW